MRTGLAAEDLGDLLDLPLLAILATHRVDGSVMLSPVWFEWRDGGFNVWTGGETDGKVRHLRRDPRATIVVAEHVLPYRSLEVSGTAELSADGFRDVVRRTAVRHVGEDRADAFADGTPLGYVVRLVPGRLRAWDFKDDTGEA